MTNPFRGLVLLLATTLFACSYQLAGYGGNGGEVFSPILKRVSVEGLGRYDSFRQALVSTLRSHGIRVVSPRRASARLIFGDRKNWRKVSAVGDDVKSREYVMTAEVSFSVVSKDLRTLLPGQSVQAQAAYLADPDHPLLDASERGEVMGDIELSLCRKIMHRLATIGR